MKRSHPSPVAILLTAVLGLQAAVAHAEYRVALLIDNAGGKASVSPGEGGDGEGDAADRAGSLSALTQALAKRGFRCRVENALDQKKLRDTIRGFAQRTPVRGTALLYFRGPTPVVKSGKEADLSLASSSGRPGYALRETLEWLSGRGGSALNLIVLDTGSSADRVKAVVGQFELPNDCLLALADQEAVMRAAGGADVVASLSREAAVVRSTLREGATVQVAGMRWGKVESLVFDPNAPFEKRITVRITLDEAVTLHDDSVIAINDATLLGGKILAIEPGSADRPLLGPDRELFGQVKPNVIDSLNEFVAENRASFKSAVDGIDTIVTDITRGQGTLGTLIYDTETATNLKDAVANVSSTFESADAMITDLRAGKGTVGKLFTEDAVYNQFNQVTADLQQILADVRAGRGTIGRLVYDEELGQDVSAAIESIRSIANDINEGRGTLGSLVKDDSIAKDIRTVTEKLAGGEGTLGRLLMEEKIYEDIRAIAEELRGAVEAVSQAEGTLGKLLMEDELYLEVEQALATLIGSLEETREAAPISTLLNTLFLGF